MMFNAIQPFSFFTGFIRKMAFPCVLCHAPSLQGICDHCFERYLSSPFPRCTCCGNSLPSGNGMARDALCGDCLKKRPSFDRTVVATDYAPPVDQLVHRLKFQFQLAIAPLMGKLIYQSIQKENRPADFFPDCVIGVPLGKRRLIERGFNQSHEIARTLAKLLEIELRADLVERNRDTEKQSTVSFQDRKKNVHNAFTVNDKATDFLSGKHIGIVDDVMTTGHTLEEIARVLKKSGVKQVTNFVFARTLPKTSQEN